jgi:hypothetical protein
MKISDFIINLAALSVFLFLYGALRLTNPDNLTEGGMFVSSWIFEFLSLVLVLAFFIGAVQRKAWGDYDVRMPMVYLALLVLILLSEIFLVY